MGILSPADVRCHGVGDGIVQYIAVHGAVLFAGDVLRVRPCGVQRLQALQPGQRGGLRFGAVQRFRLLHIAAGLLHRAGQGKAQKRHLRLEVPEDHRRMFRRRRGGQGKGVPERCHPVCAGARAGVLLHRLFQGHGAGVAPLKLRNHRSGGGRKDQGAVPLGAGCANEALPGFHLLARLHQHGAAGKVRAQNSAAAFCPDAVQRSGGNVRLGPGRGGFHHQPPFGKIQAGPGELAAVQKGVLPGGELCLGHSRTGLQARFPQDGAGPRSLSGGEGRGVRIPDELLCKEQQRHKHRQPRPKPGPAQQGAQTEIHSVEQFRLRHQ